jgi:predicted  nucleic acid-binding Zn-ribbon protein
MQEYYKDIEEVLRSIKLILEKISGIKIKLEDRSLDPNNLLNYAKQKDSSKTQLSQLEKKQYILNRNNEDEINEMELLKDTLNDVKKDLIQTSKLVNDEWKSIDEKLFLYESEKKIFLFSLPKNIQELYDDLKARGVDVIAAYKLENNQCGCCGVDLTTSELDTIFETEFQQCPYCDGILV